MTVEQIYTGCLAQGAYYIVSGGEAAIIDPLREPRPYLERLERDGVKLKYIFETHFHADFVSGHVELARATGAPIIYGPGATCDFDCISAQDNQVFELGNAKIKVIHTPGHTLESSCFLLIDEEGKETALFSGDTLFLGDVGRPDLAQKAAHMTQEELAGLLYDSLYEKILSLSDDIIVYPAHGAGSACGKNMMKETVDTLGNQKKINYALNQPDKDSFIAAVTDGLLPAPAYFAMNVAMNKGGYENYEDVMRHGLVPLSPHQFEELAEFADALILDTRTDAQFANGFIPGAINIGLSGDFAPWVGAMIADVKQPILLVTEDGKQEEAVTRLSRVGFDHVIGYLEGGLDEWVKAGKNIMIAPRISANSFEALFDPKKDKLLDVRKESEYRAMHVEEALNRPLAFINDWIGEIDGDEHFYLHCAGGYRSMIAASILLSRGFTNFTEVAGGFKAISETKVPVTDFVCQSKILS